MRAKTKNSEMKHIESTSEKSHGKDKKTMQRKTTLYKCEEQIMKGKQLGFIWM